MFLKLIPEFTKNKKTESIFYIYLLFYFLITPLIISSISFFIDFDSYEAIIRGGWAWSSYSNEPISASLLMVLHYFSLGAFELYLITWIIALVFFLIILLRLGKSFGVLYISIILNPVSIILLQFSRQYLAFLLFLMSVFFIQSKFKSASYLLLSVLSHNASALFSLLFYLLVKSNFYRFISALIASIIGFYFITSIFFSQYIIHETDKGRGRVLIVLITLLFFIILSLRRIKVSFSLVALSVFLIVSFIISPQAGRFSPYFIAILYFYGFYNFKENGSVIAIHLFFIANILASFTIISMGLFGFG